MNISRLSRTLIFVVLTIVVDVSAFDHSFLYSSVLRNNFSSICPKPEFPNGFIRMRLRGKYLRFECDTGYTLVGLPLLSCQNGRWNNEVPICVKPGCPAIAAVDNGFIYYSTKNAAATLFCDSGYKLAGPMYNYCNGTSWDRRLGSCRRTNWTIALSCDFEVNDMCGWENDAMHRLDWERSSGVALQRSLKTGPVHDHTTGKPLNGHFMMVDSSLKNMNETALLISPIYSSNYSTNACFRFFYHMYGDVGALAVYVKPLRSKLRELLRRPAQFIVSGNQSNAWIEGCLDLEQQKESFQIVIQASLGMRDRSDIAIDDVELVRGGSCNSNGTILEPITESDVDIIRAESCVNRCGFGINGSDISTSDEKYLVHCSCNGDCNDDYPCCQDYVMVCLFEVSTVAYDNEELLHFKVAPKTKSSYICAVFLTFAIFSLITSFIVVAMYFNKTSISSMIRKWRSNRQVDTLGMAEDVQYLAVNDTISNFSEDVRSVASLRLP